MTQQSSTSDLLSGSKYGKKTISSVTKRGGRRVLHFADGTKKTISKREVAHLAKVKGIILYREKYQAAPRGEKRRMLNRSRKRQQTLLQNHRARLQARMETLPPFMRRAVRRELQRTNVPVGSPLIGERSAAAIIEKRPGYQGAARRAGVTFRTIRKNGRTYVIPVQG